MNAVRFDRDGGGTDTELRDVNTSRLTTALDEFPAVEFLVSARRHC
jgi:hypothetical protein